MLSPLVRGGLYTVTWQNVSSFVQINRRESICAGQWLATGQAYLVLIRMVPAMREHIPRLFHPSRETNVSPCACDQLRSRVLPQISRSSPLLALPVTTRLDAHSGI